jgi:predicted regulator of Ras-like GTPase activity (Roadblock/LC7/MglB family)
MSKEDLASEAIMLSTLLDQTAGVVGVVLGNDQGELRASTGHVADSDASAAVAASVTGELNKVGTLLGLGELGVASIKSQSTTFVFAQQGSAAVAIQMDPRAPLGDLEAKLSTLAWASPAVNRVPTVPRPAPASQVARGGSASELSELGGFGEFGDRPRSSSGLSPLPLPPPPPLPRATQLTAQPPGFARPSPPPPPPGAHKRTPTQPLPAAGSSSSLRAATSSPVFTGDLEEFALPDLLEFLRNTQRTGLLECVGTAGVGTVQLLRGMITGADSPSAIDLREYFLTSADIDAERRRVLAQYPAEHFFDDTIDHALVARGVISADDAEAARTARIYSAFRDMMAWTSGRFSFDPGVSIPTPPTISLSAQSVLMHLYQEQDEANR